MREYGQVQSAFWQSADAQSFSDHGKLLALYLLTGPHANGIGCYWLPNGYITADLGWTSEEVDEAFSELSGNGLGNGSCNGFAYRFEGVVFIPKFLKWNKIANPNVASARFAEFDALSNTESKRRVARAMLEFCHHWSADQKKVLETVTQTVTPTVCQTEPNPTQPNPTQREVPAPSKKRSGASSPVALDTWIQSLAGEEAVKADDPIFDYADKANLPFDFIELAWKRFCEDMRSRGIRKKDWRAHFRNAVKGNWHRLWYADGDGWKLTTAGEQARRVLA